MRSSLFILVVLLSASVDRVFGYGEPYTSPAQAVGRPVYQERANFFLINAARIDPTGYKNVYMVGHSPSVATIMQTTSYPPVAPLYMEPRLVASAYNHSLDMAVNSIKPANCFQHETCITNEATFTRVGKFYSCAVGNGYKGENIAAGVSTPLGTSNQWLCDLSNGVCAADKTSAAGHRSNILSANFASVGVGYAYQSGSTYSHYWTQDFGTACTGETSPIYSGSHFVTGSTIKFAAIFYSTTLVPSSAQVFIGGTASSLAIELGSAGKASYAFSTSISTACRSYYFEFVAGGVTYRYPNTGCLSTFGEVSTCTTSYVSTCSGTPSTPAPSPTATAAPSTPAPSPTATAAPSPSPTATAAPSPSPTATAAPSPSPTATAAPSSTTGTVGPTRAPTIAPTRAPTVAPTRAATRAPTLAPTRTPTTAPGGVHYIYQNGLVNNWNEKHYNGVTVQLQGKYTDGKTAMNATLGAAGGSNYFVLNHTAMTNTWTKVVFSVVSSNPCSIYFFINVPGASSNPAVRISVTSTWQTYTVLMSNVGSPSTIGDKQPTFYNPNTYNVNFYVADVSLQ